MLIYPRILLSYDQYNMYVVQKTEKGKTIICIIVYVIVDETVKRPILRKEKTGNSCREIGI